MKIIIRPQTWFGRPYYPDDEQDDEGPPLLACIPPPDVIRSDRGVGTAAR